MRRLRKARNGARKCVCGHLFAIHVGPDADAHCAVHGGCSCKGLPRTKEHVEYAARNAVAQKAVK